MVAAGVGGGDVGEVFGDVVAERDLGGVAE